MTRAPSPIAITGMHRSGTSMITRGLHEAGLALLGAGDDLIAASDDNTEGFWENKDLVACNDQLLEAAGGSWDNPPELLPQAVDDPRLTAAVEPATAALAGLRVHEHWGFKDPRTCLTARFWLDLEPEFRFVICVRHPLEVALSLKNRNQNSYSLGLTLWQRYYDAVLDLVPADRRIVTHYDTWFLDPSGEMDRLCDFAGLDGADITVRRDLRHHDIGVSLTEAGVGRELIDLYHRLCAEAGTPVPPEPAADEAHVRRLVLDGAVARQHADQRQAAIDRLHEREASFRDEIDTLRRAKGALESRLASTQHQLDELGALSSRIDHIDHQLDHVIGRVNKAVEYTRPGPVTKALRKAARLGVRGGRRYVHRPGRIAAQQARPSARQAVRRLPPSSRRVLYRGRATYLRARARLGSDRAGPDRAGTPTVDATVPVEQWLPALEQLITDHGGVPPGSPLLTPGSPSDIVARFSRPVTDFPDLVEGDYPSHPQALVAQLDGRTTDGAATLVVPEGARAWLERNREFAAHLRHQCRFVEDRPGAGAIVDLLAPPGSAERDPARTVEHLLADTAGAVLLWTDLTVTVAPGRTAFRPPTGPTLPYLDRSVEVVVVDRAGDRAEAARVASTAVVVVDRDATGATTVHTVEALGTTAVVAPVPATVVVTPDPGVAATRRLVETRVAQAGATLRWGPVDAAALADADADVVVLVDAGLIPQPGAIGAAARAALVDGAVSGKVVGRDGRLESAGATVFADRSVGLVGAGVIDVAAPWHEYRRPVCWAPGVLAVAGPTSDGPRHVHGRPFLREWCAARWADGGQVLYRPDVVVSRVAGAGAEPGDPVPESAWQRVLDRRPARPGELGEGEWRWLLAHDDVEACRG